MAGRSSPLKQSLESGTGPLWKRGVRVTQLTNQSQTLNIELVNFLLRGAGRAGKEIILVCCVEPREVKDAGKRKKKCHSSPRINLCSLKTIGISLAGR